MVRKIVRFIPSSSIKTPGAWDELQILGQVLSSDTRVQSSSTRTSPLSIGQNLLPHVSQQHKSYTCINNINMKNKYHEKDTNAMPFLLLRA